MKYSFYNKLMIGTLSVFMFIGFAFPAWAQGQNAVEYAQKKLMLQDEDGDVFLTRLFWDTCATGIKKCILFKNVPPQASQLRAPRFMKENPIVPVATPRVTDNTKAMPAFDVAHTFRNLRQIILSEERLGLEATPGKTHAWAIEPNTGLSKLVVALATASSSRFLYVGQEENLIEWIANRPDLSVTIEDLFRQSYVLNKGNVYLTLLTIENVLSDATFEAERENTLVNQKLVDLYKASPNKFGDWYHFFGTMVAGYAGEPAHLIVKLYSIYRKISRGDKAEKATLAADKAGADIGAQLREFMEQDKAIVRERLMAVLRAQKQKDTKKKTSKVFINKQDKLYVSTRLKTLLD